MLKARVGAVYGQGRGIRQVAAVYVLGYGRQRSAKDVVVR